jgi:hypothetical protein|nr:MAG TPA: hypothetical protein [Caudoviricetes sp.]
MTDSILNSIKGLLYIDESEKGFDSDIIMHINSVFMVLNQLGVGPDEGFTISDDSATWSDFLGEDKSLEGVKTYVYMKVRMIFDPPTSSSVMDSMKRSIDEFEWRLNVAVSNKK